LLLCAEASFIVILLSLLVNVGALVGYTSQDIARSGILPAEQVVWNFQKAMRCVLVVLCFRAGFLHRQKLFDGDAHKWPNLVFTRLSQELWLLPSDEDSGVVYRRYICLALVVLGRAVLGTVRSAIKFHSHMTSEEKVDDKSVDSQICSGQFINWTIFLLDITTNCGFLLGFRAGRHYFAAAKQAFPEESDSAPELTSNGEDSSESRHQSHGEEEPDVPGRRRHSMAVPALRRPSAVQRRVRSRAVGTGDDPNDNPEDEDAQLSPKKCQLPPKEICLQAMCKGEQVDHGPIFSCYAWWTLLGLLVTSAIECLLLSYWEAALLGNRDDEVDVFRMRPYFFSWTPDFGRWRLRRVVLGSWRDLFYFAILYPATASAVFVAAVLAHHFACGRLRLVDGIMHRAVMTIMSYATLLGSQRAYFAMSCLLISWECRQLEIRANDFARRFPGLSPRQRWLQHATLVNEVKELQSRLAPLITYVFVQHLAYLFLDVARQSCDATVPFNMVHYLFRHVMFLGALAVTVWRIGKLNFSIYEKLHNAVMDLLPMNWADLGHCPNVGQTEVVLQRQHMEDWFRYLQHNIDTGRRDACICVFHLRFAAKSHVVALSVLTLLTLPVVNKVLEYYGKQVVNDRLLGGNDVSERSSFLHQMEQTCMPHKE